MALAQLSETFSQIKGKIGATVFQGYRGLTMVKTRTFSKGKWSAPWQNSKSNLATAASSWKSLTAIQIAAWNSRANLFPYIDKFGIPRVPSGYQLYVTLYLNAIAFGHTVLLDPPTPGVLTAISGEEIEILGMQTDKALWTGPDTDEYFIRVSLSNYTNSSSNIPPRHFRAISAFRGGRLEITITGTERQAVWGSPFVNGTYWYKLDVICLSSNQVYGTKFIKVVKDIPPV